MTYINIQQLKKALGKDFNNSAYLKDNLAQLTEDTSPLRQQILNRIEQLDVETRFSPWLNALTNEQKSDLDFLTQQAEVLKVSDPLLSNRIMARINRLKKQLVKIQPTLNDNEKKELTNSTPSEQKKKLNSKPDPIRQSKPLLYRYPYLAIVVLPLILFSLYQIFWASARFESQTKVIIRQPDATATLDASMAILSGLGVSNSGGSDNELLKQYIYSTDMLNYLEQEIQLKEHYSDVSIDPFSRLHKDTNEAFLDYYKQHVHIEVDSASSILAVYTQGFSPEFAKQLATLIAKRSEWYINSVGHQLAEAQLLFVQQEQKNIESRLENAQKKLLTFQQKYNLLDPNADGTAIQQIAYALEGKITEKETELKSLKQVMSARSPQILAVNNELHGLKQQLENERERLSRESGDSRPVNEIMAEFTDLKVRLELALQAYTSSQVSLEKSRIEAYRQLKYLIVVEQPTTPEESKYPDAWYNITLFAVLASMLFGIGKIIFLTVKELG
jgi:capsular polysaccharide transport system permease protein